MSHLAPEEKQYYETPLTQGNFADALPISTSCASIGSENWGVGYDTLADFNNFLTDVSKMNFVDPRKSSAASILKKNCFDGTNPVTCLKTISDDYSTYGGLLGPVPVSNGNYMKTTAGTTAPEFLSKCGPIQVSYKYPTADGQVDLLHNFGLIAGSSDVVKDKSGNYTWVVTDNSTGGQSCGKNKKCVISGDSCIFDSDCQSTQTASFPLGNSGNPFYCSGTGFCTPGRNCGSTSCACDKGYQLENGTCTNT